MRIDDPLNALFMGLNIELYWYQRLFLKIYKIACEKIPLLWR